MLLEVGRITKPHGVRGEVIVELVTDRTERAAAGSEFVTDRGPMTIVRSSPHAGRWIVAFEGVNDREGAEALRGVVLSAVAFEDPDALWVHELIGAAVVDTADRPLGVVAAVIANPASDLLELADGGLVPVRFVVSHTTGRVVVDIPTGLLDD